MDKYDIGGVVGKGSFGVVMLVTRREDGRQFVMKRMPIHNVTEKEMEAYQNEIRLLSELEHPCIVCYVESFVDRASLDLCIVMHYAKGGDLAAYLKAAKGGKLRESEILLTFVQMALALHFMHEKNILHRDLKTQNIFIDGGSRGSPSIRLGDLGISKVLNGASDLAQTVTGTPYFMSPELFKNKPYNHKSDVWALGCILYELTSLKHAFDAMNISGLANKVIQGIYPPIATSFSSDLRDLIKLMLGVSPSSRPSVKQILLQPFLGKHIKSFVRHVLSDAGQVEYQPAHVLNLRNQLDRLGAPLSGMFAEVERERGEKRASVPSIAAIEASGKIGAKKHAGAVAPSSDPTPAADDEDEIERTLVAAPRRRSNNTQNDREEKGRERDKEKGKHTEKEAPPDTVRRRRRRDAAGAGGAAAAAGGLSSNADRRARHRAQEERLAELEREHAAQMEALRTEEEAKKKLLRELERLQAMQAAKAQRLEAKRRQLLKGAAGSGPAASSERERAHSSTSTTSKESGSSSAGSSGNQSNLPIISPQPPSAPQVLSPPPPLHVHSPTSPSLLAASLNLPSLPTLAPGTANSSRNASPHLGPSRAGKSASGKLPQFSLANNSNVAAGGVRAPSPSPPSPALSFLPSVAAPLASPPSLGSSPPGSHASSPRLAAASSSATSSGLPPAPAPSMDNLKLLKRKVVAALAQQQQLTAAASSAAGSASVPASSRELADGTSAATAERRPGRPRHRSTSSLSTSPSLQSLNSGTPPPPTASAVACSTVAAGGNSGDLDRALVHEKEELARLRDERTRLEQLLTRLDEEQGLWAEAAARAGVPADQAKLSAPSPRLGALSLAERAEAGSTAASPRLAPRYASSGPIVRSPLSLSEDSSPRAPAHSLPPTAQQQPPAPQTFSSSSALPSAFDAPLSYKGGARPKGRRHSTASTGSLLGPDAPLAPRLRPAPISQPQPQPHPFAASSVLARSPVGAMSAGTFQFPQRAPSPSASPPPGQGQGQGSTKDRILAAKAAARASEASVEQERLTAARRDYFAQRVRADQRTKQFYGQASSSMPLHGAPIPSSAMYAGGGYGEAEPAWKGAPANLSPGLSASPPPPGEVHLSLLRRHVSDPFSIGSGIAAGGAAPASFPSPPLPPSSDDAPLPIYDSSTLSSHLNSDLLPTHVDPAALRALRREEEALSASRMEAAAIEAHLQTYTRRIETLRSALEGSHAHAQSSSQHGGRRPHPLRPHHLAPPSAFSAQDDGFDSDCSEWSAAGDDEPQQHQQQFYHPRPPDSSLSPPASTLVSSRSLDARKKALASECVLLVGRDVFVAAYDFLRAAQESNDQLDDDRKLSLLRPIMGDKVKHWKLIDQLLFVESC